MKKAIILSVLLLMAITFNMQSANATGVFYTESTYPVMATGIKRNCDINKLKQGQSTTNNILFLVETGDAGINAAVKNGGIKVIHYIDISEKSVFFFFRKLTTTVYGE